jgi:hypothetical protein
LVWKVENRLPKPVWITAELDSGEIPDDVLGYYLRIDGFDLGLDWKEFASTFLKDLPSWEGWKSYSNVFEGEKDWLKEFYRGGAKYRYWITEVLPLEGSDTCPIFNGKSYENILYEKSHMFFRVRIDLR